MTASPNSDLCKPETLIARARESPTATTLRRCSKDSLPALEAGAFSKDASAACGEPAAQERPDLGAEREAAGDRDAQQHGPLVVPRIERPRRDVADRDPDQCPAARAVTEARHPVLPRRAQRRRPSPTSSPSCRATA